MATALSPSRSRGGQAGRDRVFVERHEHISSGVDAFIDFKNPVVDHIRKDDVPGKQLRPVLIANPEGVTETASDRKEHPFAMALKQGVGCDRCSHLHGADASGGNRRGCIYSENAPNAFNRRIGVAVGIV